MMRRHYLLMALLTLVALLVAALAAWAQQGAAQRATIGKLTIVAEGGMDIPLSGSGPWTATKGVTVTADGTSMTCETLKVWPVRGGREIQKLEATGNVRLRGAYTTIEEDGTRVEWQLVATSQGASYDAGTQLSVMRGDVDVKATNASTGEVLTAQAGKAIYDGKALRFRFERSDQQPVRVEWQEPPTRAGNR